MNKQQQLEKLYDAARQKLTLLPGARQFVFGVGNPNAAIVFVGEAPGRDEDAIGMPFVGAAGRLLDKTLQQLGLNRTDVYITNIVKSRPPQNRKPTPEEMAEGRPLVIQEIKIIKPKVICSLGATALEALLKHDAVRMTQMRGKPVHIDEFVLVPTFHPAYLLRNGAGMPAFVSDLEQVKKLSIDNTGS